ncbi:alanine racemase [Lewinella sp. 4G2]|uniref:alanine racemase n=1 Tax=Lewinella sp. 4G2 TaxID=1803372 RepID=UPI0007B469C8|nr:alanine racemase [Lewinella sp. 4G2]OAV46158.1 alanine racemase [Lewinella sp. 4G2]
MEANYHPDNLAELYACYAGFDLVVDSRRVTRPKQTLFFALPGRKTHGVSFVEDLGKAGVEHFVIPISHKNEALPQVLNMDGAHRVTFATDPVEVLQALAAHHRAQFDIPVVGITGSNGKTIVKDWLSQILSKQFKVCASPRSYNSQIGVPLSVWQLRPEHEVAVFEAGVSATGEMGKLARIIQPTLGVFTHFGAAHDDGFANREEKLREKLSLFSATQFVVVNEAHREVRKALKGSNLELVHQGNGLDQLVIDGRELDIALPKLPRIYRENAYSALTAAYWLGMEPEALRNASSKLLPLKNRLEQTAGLHGGPVINDSYSNDLDALAAALQFAANQGSSGKVQLILGSLQPYHLPTSPGTRGSALMNLLEEYVDTLMLVGDEHEAGIRDRATATFPTTEALLNGLDELAFNSLPILVKGASHQQLGRVAKALSRHQHRTNLRIDLGAIQHNFRTYQQRVDAKMIVMVKASAYGGGSLPIARAVAEAGADYLAVAYTDEGRELRRGGVQLPIMVLNPEREEFAEMLDFDLEPVVASVNDLRHAGELGLPVHWELDTGMARLGMPLEKAADSIRFAPKMPVVNSIFTHLVASEATEHDHFTREQFAGFQREARRITSALGYTPLLHVLNSNGIARWPKLQLDAVRLGIGLYGIGDATLATELQPALRLTTRVALLRNYPAGTTIGYNRRGILKRDSLIATLSIGYADGLPRLAGEGEFSVLINGQAAPTVGAVCMDMTMVDVTDHDPHLLREGIEAVIFGPEHPVELLAAAARTIPYEILTGIGQRVHRIYVRE